MKIKLILIFLLVLVKVLGQSGYDNVYFDISKKLNSDKPFVFKEVVFQIEKAFDENLSYQEFLEDISFLTKIVKIREVNDSLEYTKKDKPTIKKYAAIFRTMTDTTRLVFGEKTYENFPFHYDFDDIFGEKKWEHMFITKLLATRKGNCHSMPFLYKILCEELGVPCYLALAPNHIYIKHRSEKVGMYNTELTSASFPIDAWLMASGYITLESIQNGVYMDALNDKQCIALCVLDLAKGYDRKYPNNDGMFIIKCCDLALEHFPKYINAMLLKAETRKKQFEKLMKERNISTPSVLRLQKDGKMLWDDMNSLYTKVHKLGYRTMPEQMYVDWLLSLKKEREKYSNKQVIEINKN